MRMWLNQFYLFIWYGLTHYANDKRQAFFQLLVYPVMMPIIMFILAIVIVSASFERTALNGEDFDPKRISSPSVGVLLTPEQAAYEQAITQGIEQKYQRKPVFYTNLETLQGAVSDKSHHLGLQFVSLRPIEAKIIIDNRHVDAVKPMLNRFKAGFDDMLLPLRQALSNSTADDAFVIARYEEQGIGTKTTQYLPFALACLFYLALVYCVDIAKLTMFKFVAMDKHSDEIAHFTALGYSPGAILATRLSVVLTIFAIAMAVLYAVLLVYAGLYLAFLHHTAQGAILLSTPQLYDATHGVTDAFTQLGVLGHIKLYAVCVLGGLSLLCINLLVLCIVKREESATTWSNALTMMLYSAPFVSFLAGSQGDALNMYFTPVLNVFFALKAIIEGAGWAAFVAFVLTVCLCVSTIFLFSIKPYITMITSK